MQKITVINQIIFSLRLYMRYIVLYVSQFCIYLDMYSIYIFICNISRNQSVISLLIRIFIVCAAEPRSPLLMFTYTSEIMDD